MEDLGLGAGLAALAFWGFVAVADLSESWLAWLISPINNIASLIVLGVKALRIGMKKLSIHPLRTSS